MLARRFSIAWLLILAVLGYQPGIIRSATNAIELGYSLPFRCEMLSPSGDILVAGDSGPTLFFDLHSGKRLFYTLTSGYRFSPSGKLLYVPNDGLYEVATRRKLMPIEKGTVVYAFGSDDTLVSTSKGVGFITDGTIKIRTDKKAIFSPDGKFVFIDGDGVYDTSTWQRTFVLGSDNTSTDHRVTFSNDSQFLAVGAIGVYAIGSGKLVLPLAEDSAYAFLFSPQSTYFADINWVYATATWERQFRIAPLDTGNAKFSADDQFFANPRDGLYQAANGQRVLSAPSSRTVAFSPDSTLFAAAGNGQDDGVYKLPEAEKLYDFGGSIFSNDSAMLLGSDAIYDLETGSEVSKVPQSYDAQWGDDGDLFITTYQSGTSISGSQSFYTKNCLVYGRQQESWQFRAGLIEVAKGTKVYSSPDGIPVLLSEGGRLAVLAATPDKKWFAVFLPYASSESPVFFTWVSAQDSQIIAMPDGVPQEVPPFFPPEFG